MEEKANYNGPVSPKDDRPILKQRINHLDNINQDRGPAILGRLDMVLERLMYLKNRVNDPEKSPDTCGKPLRDGELMPSTSLVGDMDILIETNLRFNSACLSRIDDLEAGILFLEKYI